MNRVVHTTMPVLIIDLSVDEKILAGFDGCQTHTGEYPFVVDCMELVVGD